MNYYLLLVFALVSLCLNCAEAYPPSEGNSGL